jgi:hypothetical protein
LSGVVEKPYILEKPGSALGSLWAGRLEKEIEAKLRVWEQPAFPAVSGGRARDRSIGAQTGGSSIIKFSWKFRETIRPSNHLPTALLEPK